MSTLGKSLVKDSKSFLENIKDERLSGDKEFVSFDIKDMYLSLTKYDVLSDRTGFDRTGYIIIRICVIYCWLKKF